MTKIENAFSTAVCSLHPFKVTNALKLVQRTQTL